MTEILIGADVHLGASGRLNDILWALRVMREHALRHDIDVVVILGDMFHDREALGIDVLCAAHDFFWEARHKYGQNWITFPGNHDMFLKHSWSINSLRPFRDVLTIIEDVKILKINDVRFWVLPFIHLEGAYLRVLRRIEARAIAGDVLLTHIGVIGAIKNVCFLLKDWSAVTFHNSPFDQVFTGHFHVPQQAGRNVWYPGSPIPFKFDEGDSEHGFLVYNLEDRMHELVNIWQAGASYFPGEVPPPNYLTITEEMVDTIAPEIATNNVLRVATSRDYAIHERQGIEEALIKAGARSVRWMGIAAAEEVVACRGAKVDRSDVFEAWLAADHDGLEGLDIGLIRSLHDGVAKEADDLYDYDADD